jgi:predicted metal-dependent phosphotriesterase family hydrolase
MYKYLEEHTAAGVTEAHIEQMLVHNPRALFEAGTGGPA